MGHCPLTYSDNVSIEAEEVEELVTVEVVHVEAVDHKDGALAVLPAVHVHWGAARVHRTPVLVRGTPVTILLHPVLVTVTILTKQCNCARLT